MKTSPAMHLTDDQLEDYLVGDLAAEAAAHLSLCAQCQIKAEAAAQPFASFRDVTQAWADRRSATMPVPATFVSQQAASRRSFGWVMAVSAALAVGVAVPAMRQHMSAAPNSQAEIDAVARAGTAPNAASANEIADDNAMLHEIDRALRTRDNTLATYAMEQPGDDPRLPR